jgi:hypothetical protein
MDRASSSIGRWECIDFELEIRKGGSREYPVAVRSPAGEAQEIMRFPFDAGEIEDRLRTLEIALLRGGKKRRRMPSQEEQTVQEFGRALFEALLIGGVRTRYEMSLDKARRQNKGLRLKLRVEPPELTGLPWEFLYDEGQGEYLCLSSETPLVRYVDLQRPVEHLPKSSPLRILGLVSSPLDLDPLEVEDEKRLVEEAVKDLSANGLVELTWLEGQTWRDLQRAMRRGLWNIFHFIGHGDFDATNEEGRIAFCNESGRSHLLNATHLARLLDDHHPLRLAFLNSCEGAQGSAGDPFSSTAATLVRKGIPAVVAMQYEISDKAAIEFSRSFYESVADGLPVDAAMAEARTAVSMGSSLEFGTPVLYMRMPDGRIFDISAEPQLPETLEGPEDPGEEDLQWRYRGHVEAVWADGKLNRSEVNWLSDLANNQLELSPTATADIEREIMGATKEAILERQERQDQLDDLYARARRLHQGQDWQSVFGVFKRIHAIDQTYHDPEGLLKSARKELAAIELTQRVNALYEQGLKHIEGEDWHKALECFEQVQRLKPGYREIERMLSRVRHELAGIAPSTVEVPDLSGKSASQASSILSDSGLNLGDQDEIPSATMPEGKILGQTPEAGAKVGRNSFVSVMVSIGPDAEPERQARWKEILSTVAVFFAGEAWLAAGLVTLRYSGTAGYAAVFTIALIATLGGLVGLYLRGVSGMGRLGRAGCLVASAWIVLMLLSGQSMNVDDNDSLSEVILAIISVGLTLLGVAIVRARVLPSWFRLLLFVCPLLSVFLWDWGGGVLLGLAWLALGYVIWSQRSVPVGQLPFGRVVRNQPPEEQQPSGRPDA